MKRKQLISTAAMGALAIAALAGSGSELDPFASFHSPRYRPSKPQEPRSEEESALRLKAAEEKRERRRNIRARSAK